MIFFFHVDWWRERTEMDLMPEVSVRKNEVAFEMFSTLNRLRDSECLNSE